VGHITDLARHFDVVINCTGLGAREVAGDAAMHAYRGQLIRVYAPHVRHFATGTDAAGVWMAGYVFPRLTSGIVVCGGTYERDNENLGIDPVDSVSIWQRCCALVPELKAGTVIKVEEWAGLRPGRDGDVRLELEAKPLPTGPLYMVHNYGHGTCKRSTPCQRVWVPGCRLLKRVCC
jgi:glycine/D-amino acid oxidase-like deaminating enzyme